jgi:aspartyl-tRNA(Asn)/glutamyl-tRNA(Gln) amidotransferase subunit B
MGIASLDEALARYEPVIGLEVHAQLSTRAKLFSAAPTDYAPDAPNTRITPYCLGLPGTLPVPNEGAIRLALRAGLALGCEIRETSVFARKHYFYPDLPKGYQISQHDRPLCEHGRLEVGERTIRIARIHVEEDAGKNQHVDGASFTRVDYNRAGVPLIEIVSAPDLHGAAEAAAYLRALRAILVTLEVCDGNLEEGSFRCDANVSLRPRGETALGVRCEIKNVNSFRFVEQAIEVEILRHARLLDGGEAVRQETRLYDAQTRTTRTMRVKEEADDYRYFPDPDLPSLVVPRAWIEAERAALPELPAARRARWIAAGVPSDAAETFAEDPALAAWFDRAAAHRPEALAVTANLIRTELLRALAEDGLALADAPLAPEPLAELAALRHRDAISSSQQKKLFGRLWRREASLEAMMREEGEQLDDADALVPIVDRCLADNPGQVAQFRSGKETLLAFFVGQVMKATKGKAKPPLVRDLLLARLRGPSDV